MGMPMQATERIPQAISSERNLLQIKGFIECKYKLLGKWGDCMSSPYDMDRIACPKKEGSIRREIDGVGPPTLWEPWEVKKTKKRRSRIQHTHTLKLPKGKDRSHRWLGEVLRFVTDIGSRQFLVCNRLWMMPHPICVVVQGNTFEVKVWSTITQLADCCVLGGLSLLITQGWVVI